eukprot:jgi/Hompol1/2113/HPOL_005854-RA
MFPNLESILMQSCQSVSNIVVQSLADHSPDLERISLQGCPVSDAYMPDLFRHSQKLKSINLTGTKVTIATLVAVMDLCPQIEHLYLDGALPDATPLTFTPLTLSSPTRPLKTLSLRNSSITDLSFRYVTMFCPGLTQVILDGSSGISDDSIVSLALASSQLETLQLAFCSFVTDVSLFALAKHTAHSLKRVALAGCEQITEQGVMQLVKNCKNLQEIHLHGCPQILNSYIAAYHTGDRRLGIECLIRGDSIRKLARHNRQRNDPHSQSRGPHPHGRSDSRGRSTLSRTERRGSTSSTASADVGSVVGGSRPMSTTPTPPFNDRAATVTPSVVANGQTRISQPSKPVEVPVSAAGAPVSKPVADDTLAPKPKTTADASVQTDIVTKVEEIESSDDPESDASGDARKEKLRSRRAARNSRKQTKNNNAGDHDEIDTASREAMDVLKKFAEALTGGSAAGAGAGAVRPPWMMAQMPPGGYIYPGAHMPMAQQAAIAAGGYLAQPQMMGISATPTPSAPSTPQASRLPVARTPVPGSTNARMRAATPPASIPRLAIPVSRRSTTPSNVPGGPSSRTSYGNQPAGEDEPQVRRSFLKSVDPETALTLKSREAFRRFEQKNQTSQE